MAQRNKVQHHGSLGETADGRKLYASVPMELARDEKLSPAASRVALYVWSHSSDWDQSAADVAKNLGMSRGTVGRALADLQKNGWLIREILRSPGKAKPAGERWHLQMSNTKFTQEEIANLGGPGSSETLLQNGAPSTGNLLQNEAGTCSKIEHPPAPKLSTTVVKPVVHAVHTTEVVHQELLDSGVMVGSRTAFAAGELETDGMGCLSLVGAGALSPPEPWPASENEAYAAALLAQDDPSGGHLQSVGDDPWGAASNACFGCRSSIYDDDGPTEMHRGILWHANCAEEDRCKQHNDHCYDYDEIGLTG